MKRRQLIKELRSTGASKREAVALASMAKTITAHKPSASLTKLQKKQIATDIGFAQERFALRSVVVMAYALVAAIIVVPVVVAQYSLPGDTLYFMKRGTEAVLTVIQPNYADKAADRRTKELTELKAVGASSSVIHTVEQELKNSDTSHPTDETADILNHQPTSKDSGNKKSKSTNESTESADSNKNSTLGSDSNSGDTKPGQSAPTPSISAERAIEIAKVKMAQLSPTKTYVAPPELKQDNGVAVYYVKFSKGGLITLRATDGTILTTQF